MNNYTLTCKNIKVAKSLNHDEQLYFGMQKVYVRVAKGLNNDEELYLGVQKV